MGHVGLLMESSVLAQAKPMFMHFPYFAMPLYEYVLFQHMISLFVFMYVFI